MCNFRLLRQLVGVSAPWLPLASRTFLFCDSNNLPFLSVSGALKRILVDETMVPADEIRLLFRGREILDLEILKEAGIKNGSKLMLLENLQVKQAKQDARKQDVNHLKAIKAVAAVHSDVDGHEKKVSTQIAAMISSLNLF